ncbi:glutathione S-transferase family protein [Taklimakanibacter deserti]|uniref:glutathione S-transferase family protein n=1 Tax=Taklimakanibacter deserti TaxID=2267839 RepID=UPI000E65971A
MKLHYTPGSPFARIIRVLVRELALDCKEVAIRGFPPANDYFAINPLGQVPALETAEGVKFPTRIIIDFLMALPRREPLPVARAVRRWEGYWQDDQLLAVLLAMGDALAAIKYQNWAGLRPGGKNLLGFDPADRHAERLGRTLDWLEGNAAPDGFLPGVLSVQDIALASFVLWTEARGGFPWRGRPRLEAIVAGCAERPSFAATEPQPWP